MADTTAPLNLADIDESKLVEKINEALTQIAADIISRPKTMGPRQVVVQVEVKPDADVDPDSEFQQPLITYNVRTVMPKQKGRTTRGLIKDGKIIINRFEHTQPAQLQLDNVVQMNTAQG